jgi:MoxR-like ATPase
MTETTFAPTDEQQEALRLFATGKSLAIEAGAGAGKTSTLKLLAESTTAPRPVHRLQQGDRRRGQDQDALDRRRVDRALASPTATSSAATSGWPTGSATAHA